MDREYENAVREREDARELYRRAQRRGGRRTRFVFPTHLQQIPNFSIWVEEEVRLQQQSGARVDAEVIDTTRGPLPMAATYKSMYAFGNHYRVLSSERPLRTRDSGVAATFRQVCRNGRRDGNQIDANVEYVGHIEEILELNYRRHCLVVLVCDFVKANYVGENATVKKDKWGFTLANYDRRFGRICRDSFAFPSHCEQVFYSNAREAPGWRVVLRKEVRGRRVLPNNNNDEEPTLFQMGRDEEFEGLRPDREVGENGLEPATTGETVILDPVFRPTRGVRRGRGMRGGGGMRGPQGGRPEQLEQHRDSNTEEDEELQRGNNRNVRGRNTRSRTGNSDQRNRNVGRRHQSDSDSHSSNSSSSEEGTPSSEMSTSETSSSFLETDDEGEVTFHYFLLTV